MSKKGGESGAEALAALGPSPSQHGATVAGRHARAKAVGTLPLQITWLKSALHFCFTVLGVRPKAVGRLQVGEACPENEPRF